jgi:hypothetical protein
MKHNINPYEIEQELSVPPSQAQLILDLIEGKTSPDPYVNDYECSRRGFRHETILAAINHLIEGAGVESLGIDENGYLTDGGDVDDTVLATFIQTGDLYSPTILYDHANKLFSLTTVGDFREQEQI